MADGTSKAHQRQSSKNKSRRAARVANGVTQQNQLRRMLRHAKKAGLEVRVGANAGEVSFFRHAKSEDGKWDKVTVHEMNNAWRRCGSFIGVGRCKTVLAERRIAA